MMAAKNKSKDSEISIKDITDNLQNGSGDNYLYDEWLIEDKLRLVIDVNAYMNDIELYQTQLLIARGIPQQPSGFRPDDPNINRVSEYYKNIKDRKKRDDSIIAALESHYQRLIDKMQALGAMLAATKYTIIEDAPKPYDDEDQDESLPGVMTLPEPIPDLDNPVEYRLKQILDLLIEHPAAFIRLQEIFKSAKVVISQYNANGGNAPGE
jgi:hypothetical protein